MKRTITSTMALLTLLVASRASAQPPVDRVDAAKEQYERAEHLLQQVGKAKRDGQIPRELREKLRPLVEESFEARQRLQRAELEALRRRLGDIEAAINDRGKNKEAIISARIEDVLNGKTASPTNVLIRPANNPNSQQGLAPPPSDASAEVAPTVPRRQQDSPDFDLETRQRLAELDLQAAEEDYFSAEKDVSQARALHETGGISATNLRSREKDYRHAALELKRAKVKLDGLASQRAELQAKADEAIDAAMALEQEAMARFNACRAEAETAQARVAAAAADVDHAESTFKYREKQYQRLKKLVEEKAVDEKLLDEATEHLDASKAGLDAAKAALAVAVANLNQSKRVVEERVAEVKSVQGRVHAAKVERSRLGRRGQGDTVPTRQDNVEGTPNSE